ncbi:MAG: metal ABC transporter permease [Actinomycetales bacterium]|nr:metal ABC transporter permease [Actinomycetales bacterium]
MSWLTDPLTYEFFVRALTVTTVAAVVCAVLSCWLVLIGWALMGDAVSHAVLPGVVLAYVLGAPFAIGALVFALIAVALIGGLRDSSRLKEDTAIGVVFTSIFALGLVLISVTPSQTDLAHILFGNLLGVSTGDAVQVFVLAALAVVVLVAKRRDLTLFAFDPIHAFAIGLSPRWLSALLLGLLAVVTVTALQAVGVILVVALLIIPGATAYLLTDRFARMLLIAPAIAGACAILGIYASFWLDASPGGVVVLTMSLVFAVVYLASPRHGVLARRVARRRARKAFVGPASPAPEGNRA